MEIAKISALKYILKLKLRKKITRRSGRPKWALSYGKLSILCVNAGPVNHNNLNYNQLILVNSKETSVRRILPLRDLAF